MAKKLHKFLQTERRNWRKDVFLIDDDTVRSITANRDYTEKGIRKNIRDSHFLSEFLHIKGCDVVLSIMSPYLDYRDELKDSVGVELQEIFLHNSNDRDSKRYKVPTFDHPEVNFIDIDTTKKSPENSFSKLITNLTKIERL